MAKGIVASFLGMLVVACSGCGGGGGGSSENATSAPPAAKASAVITAQSPASYSDGRPGASYRLPSTDYGVVLPHGTAPGGIDVDGARDVFVYRAGGTYYMTYDGSGGPAWNTVMATSTDLTAWTVKGHILPLGNDGAPDSKCVCYAQTFFDGSQYRMYYTTATTQTPAPYVPLPTYQSMLAVSPTPDGPWKKTGGVQIQPQAGSYYADTVTPGWIVQHGGQYLQFFSAAQNVNGKFLRTIGIARSNSIDGPWTPDSAPALPQTEQLENASIYFQESTKTYFMFVNHVGIRDGNEFGDAAWVYWTQDPTQWDASHKAVVIDGQSSNWSKTVVGIPSVLQVGDRLAVFYDGNKSPSTPSGSRGNLDRDIGLAWVNLPIETPRQ
jgi:predicted GH43/DUF377 family glycosyl hydrolase